MAEERRLIDRVAPDMREVERLPWPGKEQEVGLLLLRCDEIQEAHFAAREAFAKKAIEVDQASGQAFLEEEEVQFCFRMLIDPESKRPTDRLFKNVAEARSRLDPDIRNYFVGWHVHHQVERAKKYTYAPKKDEQK